MTFFFQTNPIRVILKMVLALPSVIMAVNGCFFVQQSNKPHPSIINDWGGGEYGYFSYKNALIRNNRSLFTS